MNILYPSARRVKSARRVFGLGIIPQREPRLPVGPPPDDKAWLAAQNATADATDAEWQDELEVRTLTAAEYREYQAELQEIAAERYCDAHEADIAACGSQVGHGEEPSFASDFYTPFCSEGR